MSEASALFTGGLPGISRVMREINARIANLALSDEGIIFLTGEAGTERALAARMIHQISPRASRQFLRITANWKLPPDFSSQIRKCEGGTLFLNLVREFPVEMQYTILEMALDKAFTDPLSGEDVQADVRLILTTPMDLETLCEASHLLPELRDLLSTAHIDIPPLRERREDIPALVRFALQRARETGQSLAESVDRRVLALLRGYSWPGNAEELLLVAAQSAIKATGPVVTLTDLPEDFLANLPPDAFQAAKALRAEEVAEAPPPVLSMSDQETSRGEVALAEAVPMPSAPETPIAMLSPTAEELEAMAAARSAEAAPSEEVEPAEQAEGGVPLEPAVAQAKPAKSLSSEDIATVEETPPEDVAEALRREMAEEAAAGAASPATAAGAQEAVPPGEEAKVEPSAAAVEEVLSATEARASVAAQEVEKPIPDEPETEKLSPSSVLESVPSAEPPVPQLPPRKSTDRMAQELLALTSRLHTQTSILARQMEGPLPPAGDIASASQRPLDEYDLMRLDEELSRSLDQVLQLRRQLALLNERERESAALIRNLLLRLDLTSPSPAENAETGHLANYLAEVDAIIERITSRLPKISEDIQQNIRRLLGRNQ